MDVPPGTRVEERLERGDVGVSQIDNACKQHDIAYNKARTKKDIQRADEKLVLDIDRATDSNRFEKGYLKAGLKAKILGESVGLFDPRDFTDIPTLEEEKDDPLSGIRNSMLSGVKNKKMSMSGEGINELIEKIVPLIAPIVFDIAKQQPMTQEHAGGFISGLASLAAGIVVPEIINLIKKI